MGFSNLYQLIEIDSTQLVRWTYYCAFYVYKDINEQIPAGHESTTVDTIHFLSVCLGEFTEKLYSR